MDRPTDTETELPRDVDPESSADSDPTGASRSALGLGPSIAIWSVVAVIITALVLYLVEPIFQQREQAMLLDRYAASIDRAANQATGLGGVETSTIAPSLGSAVGILETGAIALRQVVVEGSASAQTAKGPGHVPGTSGPGQPGNSVIVGRASMFDGPFGRLSEMAVGDRLVVSTTQGRSLYVVTDTGSVHLTPSMSAASAPEVPAPPTPTSLPPTDAASDATGTTETTLSAETTLPPETTVPVDATTVTEGTDAPTDATEVAEEPAFESSLDGRSMSIGELYGPSTDDRLTLVTSDSLLPFNSAQARVVIAVMVGKPFEPTPQNGRVAQDQGNTGDSSKWPLALLAAGFLAATVAAAVVLQRRSTPKVAYVLTVPPLLAFLILTSESIGLLLPAWS